MMAPISTQPTTEAKLKRITVKAWREVEALSTVGSSIGVFLIWGFSMSLAPLFVFSIVYGLFAMMAPISTQPTTEAKLKRITVKAWREVEAPIMPA
jgi:hypothetical protein